MLFISHHATSRAIARAVDFPRSVLARGGDRVLRIVFRGWRSDRAQQLLKVGSVGGAARVPAIVIAGSDLGPAGMDLVLPSMTEATPASPSCVDAGPIAASANSKANTEARHTIVSARSAKVRRFPRL